MAKHSAFMQNKLKKQVKIGDGLTVMVRKNSDGSSDIDTAIRTLKRRVQREGMAKDMQKNEYYLTKSQKRQHRINAAKRRNKKMLRDAAKDL